MREHIEVGFGIVVKNAPTGRQIVAERRADEGRICQQPRKPVGNLRERIRKRLRFEDCAAFPAEFIERVCHGGFRVGPSAFTSTRQVAHLRVHSAPVRAAPRTRMQRYTSPSRGRAVTIGLNASLEHRGELMLRLPALIGLVLAATCAFWSAPSWAQESYPSRTVKFVIPSLPGSTTDTLARIVAEQLGQKWGKPTIVENIPGGAMNIGAGNVARATPDGYTLLIAPPSPLSFNHLLYRDPGYDPTKFVPITLLAKIPNVLVVRKELPAGTLRELIDHGKANPGKLSYASQGVGSTAHLSAAQLEVQAGIKMVHVPYRGAQPALTDVVAGHVDMFFDTLATSVPLYRDGKVKLLGVADLQRAATAPDVPTFSEAGLPGFKSITWFGLVAPPATPADLAEKINRDTVEILRSREVTEMLRKISLEPGATSPAETSRFFAEETALWGKVIKQAGIEPQ
jgi:tripartite-type tricarboxylate transporter receptor subunit TctC